MEKKDTQEMEQQNEGNRLKYYGAGLNRIPIPLGVYYEEDDTYGKFEIGPLAKSYGITLGNLIRRIALTSISGAAIVAVRFKGIKHEFAGIPGIVEDVPTIILNLKKVRFKIARPFQNIMEIKLKFVAEGDEPYEIKAGDLETPLGIEIVNKDQHIATLVSKDAELIGEIHIAYGRGYMVGDEIYEDLKRTQAKLAEKPDVIFIDAVFTPVVKANFYVEDLLYDSRKFDKEKLVVEIWTDGSRKPSEAFFEAVDIAGEMLAPLNSTLSKPIEIQRVIHPDEDKEFKRRKLATPVAAILKSELPSKLVRAIEKAGIRTFGELLKYTPENLREEYGFSEEDVALIEEAVKRLEFEMGRDYWKELEVKDEA
ncbi:MAG: hypothetical protein GXO29_01865 [Thermotogae bacterium]|nr:hypothetical protein [Thermotogota bacterium]